MNPFEGRHWSTLSADELKQRRQWMAEEANRLIEARRKATRPASGVAINALPTPAKFDSDVADRRQVQSVAARLAAALARHD